MERQNLDARFSPDDGGGPFGLPWASASHLGCAAAEVLLGAAIGGPGWSLCAFAALSVLQSAACRRGGFGELSARLAGRVRPCLLRERQILKAAVLCASGAFLGWAGTGAAGEAMAFASPELFDAAAVCAALAGACAGNAEPDERTRFPGAGAAR